MMGASSVVGIDIDSDALEVARTNIELVEMEEEEIELVNARVELPGSEELGGEVPIFIPKNYGEFETVVLNPPFGTQVKGIDMAFLEVACSVSRIYLHSYLANIEQIQVAQNSIYSLHKTSTREFILKKCLTWGFKGEVLAEMKVSTLTTLEQ